MAPDLRTVAFRFVCRVNDDGGWWVMIKVSVTAAPVLVNRVRGNVGSYVTDAKFVSPSS